MWAFLSLAALCLSVAPLAAQTPQKAVQQAAQMAPPPQVPPPAAGPRDYVIGSQDLIAITVMESPELSREVRVGLDGTVSMPLLAERIRLQGLTLGEAERLLEKKYKEAGILNAPNVSIFIKELVSKPVTVSGAVRTPGTFQLGMQVPLVRVLTQAGGLSDEAGGMVQIIRGGALPRATTDERPEIISIRIDDIFQGKPEANVPVHGGDIVNVVPAGAVYVVGAVNKPGRYLLRGSGDDLTVLRVLAMAEDTRRSAKVSQTIILRKDASLCPEGAPCGPEAIRQIPVDIKKILKRESPDVALLANDVLFVPESMARRAFTRGLEAALQVATGVAVVGAVR